MAKELKIQVIQQARAGNTQCLAAVAEQVRTKVDTNIYRLTLDYHLSQDLTQETVLEMITSPIISFGFSGNKPLFAG